MLRGSHLVMHWSRTQQVVALSSCEAELNALCKAAQEGLAAANLAGELKQKVKLELLTDSSAAGGVLMRQGAGKVKHLSVRQLWVQDLQSTGALEVRKIPREINWSDALTHHYTKSEAQRAFTGIGSLRQAALGVELGPSARGGVLVEADTLNI